MNIITPNAWLKDVYISRRSMQSEDNEGNPLYTFGTPEFMRLNHQPLSALTATTAEVEIFGANILQIQKVLILNKPFPDIREFDKAYLDGIVPTGELIAGHNANYTVKITLIQNEAMAVYFEKLPGLDNARI